MSPLSGPEIQPTVEALLDAFNQEEFILLIRCNICAGHADAEKHTAHLAEVRRKVEEGSSGGI